MRRTIHLCSLLLLIVLLAACRPPATADLPLSAAVTSTAPAGVTSAAPAVATPAPPTLAPSPSPTATPIYTGPLSPACGQRLPALPAIAATPDTPPPDTAAVNVLRPLVPETAWPGLEWLLDAPGTVGLVAYQLGQEAEGVYWNADRPLPLASVAKVITLIAYAEAVAAGELNPLEQIPLAELDRFYLPNFDLGAHRRAVAELRETGRVFG
ncbi:serine hydrolase, partial [Promineifilum sp.]|uniref:serine hydrolase n=1 Tax=Promineifilum sp. TaxID=2664178 RepID=UPI0035AF391F